ncbi:MAG: inositol monophosphatase family protein [Janthinobacterium lividum]
MSTFTHAELGTVVEILRDAARTEIMPRFRGLVPKRTREKTSRQDLVTDADEAAEILITAALSKAFPGCVVVGEEATERDPSLLDALAEPDLAFVIDPIDGTKNFASNLPLFGVMAAVLRRGEIVAGVILDPVEDDWALALRGEGAWLQRADGRREDLRVGAAPALSEMAGLVSWTFFPGEERARVPSRFPRIATASDYRCAAHQYRLLCGGFYDFALYSKLMPWDHAAGWLLHREAGGYSACLDGTPYVATRHEGGLLCAPDRDSWNLLKRALLSD